MLHSESAAPAIISHLYGEADDIPVEPPNVPGMLVGTAFGRSLLRRTIFPVDMEQMFPEEKRCQPSIETIYIYAIESHCI